MKSEFITREEQTGKFRNISAPMDNIEDKHFLGL
jgi:hypothetical protein